MEDRWDGKVWEEEGWIANERGEEEIERGEVGVE